MAEVPTTFNPGDPGTYWMGADGQVYVYGADGVNAAGPWNAGTDAYWGERGYRRTADPATGQNWATPTSSTSTNQPSTSLISSGGSGSTEQDEADAKEAAERAALLAQIAEFDIDSIYNPLYSDLDTLLADRTGELESDYAEQLSKLGTQFADAMPQIQSSYAALGAQDSTDVTGANRKAETGLKEATEQVGKNKADDLAEIAQYGKETRNTFDVQKAAANRLMKDTKDTEDVGALRSARDNLRSNSDQARLTRGTLGTDGSAKKELLERTGDGGRYEAAVGALDGVLKSSLSGAVKRAAVEAITTSAGLTDDEKKKVDEQYGNVYAEQSAL